MIDHNDDANMIVMHNIWILNSYEDIAEIQVVTITMANDQYEDSGRWIRGLSEDDDL